ncbi:hypothetical protein IID19_05560 [Patescibacteria group bacterium]|nr:hypothetical protein [Patescibacteria group bacterium]
MKNLVIIMVIIIVVIGVFTTIKMNPGTRVEQTAEAATQIDSSGLPKDDSSLKQTASMGAVNVDIELRDLDLSSEETIFSVAFNTHSVDLDFDFTEIISMTDDLGQTYNASEWTGNRGWHHVSGDIIFPKISEEVREVVVTITGIEGLTESFNWQMP